MPRPFDASLCRLVLPVLMLVSLAGCSHIVTAEDVVPAANVGNRIEPFTLPDHHGRDRSLAEFDKADILVVAFLGTECPLARLYGPRLQELNDEYASRGVAFIGIDANHQDALTEMTSYTRQYGVTFPFLKDRDGAVADQFGAARNPEVFVLDRNRVVRYRGRVDDQYGLGSSSGYARPELKQRNLGQALDELLAGKPVSESVTQVTGCIIGRAPKASPQGDVTYSKHIATIINDRCVSCHREGQIGPFVLNDYESVSGWGAMIKEVVSDGRMPPWSASPKFGHFSNDPRLSDKERELLFAWVDNGCPQGDAADSPPQREFADGWRIDKPDDVFYMRESYRVPAEGVLGYRSYSLEPNWTEDKWIQQAEVQPGSYPHVHHIVVNISPSRGGFDPDPDGLDTFALRGGRLGGYNPGRNPIVYPPGTAYYAPKGSRITFQMHYTTNGTPGVDKSRIGLVYADPKTVKYVANTVQCSSHDFGIPPHAANHKVVAEQSFYNDTQLIVLHPHMHLRGKSMLYEIFYPNGTRETLLDVDRFDFNWQFDYLLAEPKEIPRGSRMRVTAHFDNSENNVANPDPDSWVGWGSQTWDEMMIGYYTTITPREDLTPKRGPQSSR